MRTTSLSIILMLSVPMLSQSAWVQTYGIGLHNSVMPVSGGMGGASFTRPQDVQSAINANPATMSQFRGTTTGFGGVFIEPTCNFTQTAPLPLLGEFPCGYQNFPDTHEEILDICMYVLEEVIAFGTAYGFRPPDPLWDKSAIAVPPTPKKKRKK